MSDQTVGPDREVIELGLEPTDALGDEVADQVDVMLEDCLDTTEIRTNGCPFLLDDVPFREEPVRWSVAEEPTTQEYGSRGAVVTATVRAVYQGSDEPDGPERTVTEDIDVQYWGYLEFTSTDEVTIEDDPAGWQMLD